MATVDAKRIVRDSRNELQRGGSLTHDPRRRTLLGRSAAGVAVTVTGGGLIAEEATAQAETAAQPLSVPASNRQLGRPIPESEYGMPSKFEAHVKRRRSDVLKNRQNFSDWSMTPLQHQLGTVTPTGLIYERHHNGVPDIDPEQHQLAIHGMVRQPLLLQHGRSAQVPVGLAFLFHGVLRQRPHRLAQARLEDRAADPRPAVVCAMDGRARLHAARRSGDRSGRHLGAGRRRRWGGPCAQHPDEENARRRLARLCRQRRDAAPRERLSAAPVPARLGGQHVHQVAAPDQARRQALAPAQRNGALLRSHARRQVAPVQLRDGRQVRHHVALGRHECAPRRHRDPGLCMVRQRHHSRRRCHRGWRAHLARGNPGRARARQVPHPLSIAVEMGRLTGAPWRAAWSTPPATSSPPSRTSRRSARSRASSSTTTGSSRGPSKPPAR